MSVAIANNQVASETQGPSSAASRRWNGRRASALIVPLRYARRNKPIAPGLPVPKKFGSGFAGDPTPIMKFIDLHVHTTHSDGTFTIPQALDYARNIGLSAIAITDHDRVSGISEAMDYALKTGLEVVPGIEFTTIWGNFEVHILGYYLDHRDPQLHKSINNIDSFTINTIKEMVRLMQNDGYPITFDDVLQGCPTTYVGRAALGKALIKKKIATSTREVFSKTFIDKGGRYYLPFSCMGPEEAIRLIKQAGGIPVAAHPAYFKPEGILKEKEICGLKEMGIEGLEVWHTRHSEVERKYYEGLARQLRLLPTGGSDCHGNYYDPVLMGTQKVPYRILEALKQKRFNN